MLVLARVAHNLWVGSHPVGLTEPFDKLVVCSMEQASMRRFPQVSTLFAPLAPYTMEPEDVTVAVQTARAVAGWRRRDKKVLVTCTSGHNRSALVAALALMVEGASSKEAIITVRSVVPEALYNESFVQLLNRIEDARSLHIRHVTA